MLVINVRKGDYVKAGDAIFKVDSCPKSGSRIRLTFVTDCEVSRGHNKVCEDQDGKFIYFPKSKFENDELLRMLQEANL